MKKNELLLKLSSAQFAMWEMRIYLDTHENNKEAMKLYKKYYTQFEELKAEYEESYGPLTLNGANSDEWLQDPWPWDNC
ncbi:MAG: spore coat protein CotJB [Clostridiales bacterium]|nr:spore coat protein CotJB [Clostridiales bacterium]